MGLFGIETRKERALREAQEAKEAQERAKREAFEAQERAEKEAREAQDKEMIDRWFDGYEFKNPETEEACKRGLVHLYKVSLARLTDPCLCWTGEKFVKRASKEGYPYAKGNDSDPYVYKGNWVIASSFVSDINAALPQNVTIMQLLKNESSMQPAQLLEILSDEFLDGPVRKAFHELYEVVYLDSISQEKGRSFEQTRTLLETLCKCDYEAGAQEKARCLGLDPKNDWTHDEQEKGEEE